MMLKKPSQWVRGGKKTRLLNELAVVLDLEQLLAVDLQNGFIGLAHDEEKTGLFYLT
jgi:hypothetical protein